MGRKRLRKCVCVNNEKQRDSHYANEASLRHLMLGRFNERIYLNSLLMSTPVESGSSPVHTFAYVYSFSPPIRSFN